MKPARRPKVIALSSGGGHWVQLLRLAPAFEGVDLLYVTVYEAYKVDVPGQRFVTIPDSNRWNKIGLAKTFAAIFWLFLRERPDVVITTGAAPGYFAVRIAGWLGARSVWIDSVANAEKLSMSGQQAGKFADLWLTQWSHMESPKGPLYRGSVL